MKKYSLQLQNEVVMKKHILHKELFKIDDNLEFKIFLAVLMMSTMICKKNKEFSKSQSFSIKGFMSKKGFLPHGKLSKQKIADTINSFEMGSFFDTLECVDETVYFQLSELYRKTFQKKGFQKIDLMKLKGCRSINSTKIAVLTQIQPSGFYYLNYLSGLLHLEEFDRPARIRAIKKAFARLDNITFYYCYPKTGETRKKEHFSFIYEQVKNEETKEIKEEQAIETKSPFIEEEYTNDFFDIEEEKNDIEDNNIFNEDFSTSFFKNLGDLNNE